MFDVIVTALALVFAVICPRCGQRMWQSAERTFCRLASRRRASLLVVFAATLVACAAFAAVVGWPAPSVHDEFAYLLGADTFARGRWTNPPHRLWEHFESFHILQQPTYQMKYPPGQAIVMAVGMLLGDPLFGICLSLAAANAAVCWMLQGCMPPRWALFGALLCATHAGLIRFWGQGYMGGAVAMTGGALLFGGLFRLQNRASLHSAPTPAVVMSAIGLAILANSRPYEGLVAAMAALVWMAAAIVRPILSLKASAARLKAAADVNAPMPVSCDARGSFPTVGRSEWLRAGLAGAAVLAISALVMMYYHYQVTGNPVRMPYQVWQAVYSEKDLLHTSGSLPPAELLNKRRIPVPAESYRNQRQPDAWPDKLFRILIFFVRPMLALGLGTALVHSRRRSSRRTTPSSRADSPRGSLAFLILSVTALVMLAILVQETGGYPHYAAPVAGLLFCGVTLGFRYVRACDRHRGTGRMLVRLAIPVSVLTLAAAMVEWRDVHARPSFAKSRAALVRQLEERPGDHLVLVRYRPDHILEDEWVYNSADIDAARVVWARSLSPEKDRRLLDYFGERYVWVLDADHRPPRLIRPLRRASTSVRQNE